MSAADAELAVNFDSPDSKLKDLIAAGDLYKVGEELYGRGNPVDTGTNRLKVVSLRASFLNTDFQVYIYQSLNSYSITFPQLGFKIAIDKDSRILYISSIYKTRIASGSDAFSFATGFGKHVLKADGFTLIDAAVINCDTDGQVPLSLSRIFQGKSEASWYNSLAIKDGLKLGYAEKNITNRVPEAIAAIQTLNVGDVFDYVADVLDFLLMKPNTGYILVKDRSKTHFIAIGSLAPEKSPFSKYETAYLLLNVVKDKTKKLGVFLNELSCEERSAIYEIIPTAHRTHGLQYVDRFQTGVIPRVREFPKIGAFYTIMETHIDRKYLVGGKRHRCTRRTRRAQKRNTRRTRDTRTRGKK